MFGREIKKVVQLFGCLLLVVPLTGCAQPPPFDDGAAKNLSAEKRREFDVIYFNEFYFSAGVMSNRYLSEDEIAGRTVPVQGNYLEKASVARRAEFKRMADAGYLPAYVFLHQTPEYVLRYSFADEALGMLAAAARAGDVSAACALVAMTRRFDSVERRKSIAQEHAAAIAIGLKANHGGCLAQHGGSFFNASVTKEGVVSYPRYDSAGFPYLFEAARQGYYLAFHLLRNLRGYELQKSNYVISSSLPLERYLCWARLVGQYSRSSGIDTQTITWTFRGSPLHGKPPSIDPKYFPVLDKYDPAVVPLTVQVATPESCLQLETQ